ncbi:hypothetical protein ACF8GD_00425 [Pseudomonas putida]|uniref:hypothetical protein n=1 Tax=Pseudomonas putida TaxID=303 RepID=UPI00370BC995
MLTQTREYHPLGAQPGAKPVKFHVSFKHLHVDIVHPYTKLCTPISQLSFEDEKFGLERIPVVRVSGGTGTDLFWNLTLKPEDAADLQAVIVEVHQAVSAL